MVRRLKILSFERLLFLGPLQCRKLFLTSRDILSRIAQVSARNIFVGCQPESLFSFFHCCARQQINSHVMGCSTGRAVTVSLYDYFQLSPARLVASLSLDFGDIYKSHHFMRRFDQYVGMEGCFSVRESVVDILAFNILPINSIKWHIPYPSSLVYLFTRASHI